MITFSLGCTLFRPTFRDKVTFSLASVPGEETGIDSVSVTGPGAVHPA